MTWGNRDEIMASDGLKRFLDFLREAGQAYNIALDNEARANAATQDILHSFELDDNSYYENGRLTKALQTVRRERRSAKNRIEALQPIVDWIACNEKTVKNLEEVLGAVRKAERRMEWRTYAPKTDIVQKTIGERERKETDK